MQKPNYEHVKAWRARPENKGKRNEEKKRWRARHPELATKIAKDFRERHGDELRAKEAAQARVRRKADPTGEKRRRDAFRARKDAKRAEAVGRSKPEVCDICRSSEFRIVFDHCHDRGHFRGWICDRCNKVLGLVRDDVLLLTRMTKYLRADAAKIAERQSTLLPDVQAEPFLF